MSKKEMLRFAGDLKKFLDGSPTPSHCIANAEKVLKEKGFTRLEESSNWDLKKNDKFYVVRHNSALIAGVMGTKDPSQAGFRIIGSHTDSPSFKLKPKAAFTKEGFIQLATEVYGGPLFASWLDRELSLAGRVVVKKNRGYDIRLVDLKKPVLIIPQLAIHYNRDANKAFNLNPQENLVPVMGLSDEQVNDDLIKDLIAKELKTDKKKIVNYDLELYPVEKGGIAGLYSDFFMSKGIDDKSMVHASLHSLLESGTSGSGRILAFYDNEEVGSSTTNGGKSSFTQDILERLCGCDREKYLRAVALSYFMSADGAHSIHPNYVSKFENMNKVWINKGPVIKINANTSYASTVESGAVFEMVCDKNKIPYQKFVNRSDIRGGGTIGSMIAANLGMRTVDVGNAIFGMHSARETAGVKDHFWMKEAMKGFLEY